jgi:hypothetical protein
MEEKGNAAEKNELINWIRELSRRAKGIEVAGFG